MKSCELEKTDFLVVGSGVAAMRCAIALAEAGSVVMLTKHDAPGRPTKHTNGMIPIASTDEVDIRLHYEDTVCAGEGLCNPAAVKVLVEEGPRHIQELISWGAEFERDSGKVLVPKEGAKPRSYTFRGRGQSTLSTIHETLRNRLTGFANIKILPHCRVEDLILKDGTVVGAKYQDLKTGRHYSISARAVFVGTGGMGQVYPETTNSPHCTGDGLAIAYRGGADLSDMEFIQFHPTVLYLKNAPRVLLPESLRAEGAYLRNADLQRFMHHYHQQEELAPRDVVSRAMMMEMMKTQSGFAYLDCTHLDAEILKKRFPELFQMFLEFNIDITENMIPVHPAAHYCIGGIKIDIQGRSSLPGLYAAGEVACSGVHGSNRLSSNSLLESLVFGARAGTTMGEECAAKTLQNCANGSPAEKSCSSSKQHGQAETLLSRTQSMMWQSVGVIRTGQNLRQALTHFQDLSQDKPSLEVMKHDLRLRNLVSVANIVASSALAREESRGAHYREDFPLRQDPRFLKHSLISKDKRVTFLD